MGSICRIGAESQLNKHRCTRMGVELALRVAQIVVRAKVGNVVSKNGLLVISPHEGERSGSQDSITYLMRKLASSLMEAQKTVRIGIAEGIDVECKEEFATPFESHPSFLDSGQVAIFGPSELCLNGLARVVQSSFEISSKC